MAARSARRRGGVRGGRPVGGAQAWARGVGRTRAVNVGQCCCGAALCRIGGIPGQHMCRFVQTLNQGASPGGRAVPPRAGAGGLPGRHHHQQGGYHHRRLQHQPGGAGRAVGPGRGGRAEAGEPRSRHASAAAPGLQPGLGCCCPASPRVCLLAAASSPSPACGQTNSPVRTSPMRTSPGLQKHQRAQQALEALPPQRELVSATQDLQACMQLGRRGTARPLLRATSAPFGSASPARVLRAQLVAATQGRVPRLPAAPRHRSLAAGTHQRAGERDHGAQGGPEELAGQGTQRAERDRGAGEGGHFTLGGDLGEGVEGRSWFVGGLGAGVGWRLW